MLGEMMAEPVRFEQANRTWVGPGDTGDLPVYQEPGLAISCWQLTPEEVKQVAETGQVWLRVYTDHHPAVYVTPEHPWEDNDGGAAEGTDGRDGVGEHANAIT